ncbi:MAG: folate-binding protein [Betaproteobacteria bacterium]
MPLSTAPDSASFEAARASAVASLLPGVALVDITGADARTFLQGQLSNDVAALAPGAAQWTTYNSPKGRMLATPLLWRATEGERYRMALAADVAEPVRKRLSMFVLRAKATLALAPLAAIGVGGPAARAAVEAALGVAVGHRQVAALDEGGEAIGLPDGRILLVVSSERVDATLERLAAHATLADEAVWRWLAIRAGVVEVRLATQEKHIAQTANWEVVGGVSFTKGCYPGQEIVARVQHLGFLKERAHPFHVEAPPPDPNTRIFVADSDQMAGIVVDAVALPGGGSELIAVVHLIALDADLRLGAPDGARLARLPLPYALPASAPKRVKL